MAPIEPDDDELMARIAAGDERAMQAIVGRWEKPVLAFLTRMLGSIDDARDLGSETFWRVWKGAPDYRAQGQFKSWLFRIAGNLARSKLRRRKVLTWVGFDPQRHDRPDDVDPEAVGLAAESSAQLRRALARLPQRQRRALLLRHYQEMSYREVAAAMHTSVSAIETLLHRAMKNLRTEMEREGAP